MFSLAAWWGPHLWDEKINHHNIWLKWLYCGLYLGSGSVCLWETDRKNGWYKSWKTTTELQTCQGRWKDIHLHLSWISLSPMDAQSFSVSVYVCLWHSVAFTDYGLSAYAFRVYLMSLLVCCCKCICVYISVFVFPCAAYIRLVSGLIAEGTASIARPNHSWHSVMSFVSVTHLALLCSSCSLFLSDMPLKTTYCLTSRWDAEDVYFVVLVFCNLPNPLH